MSDYSEMSDTLQRRDVQQAFEKLCTEVQRLADMDQRRRLTLTLGLLREQLAPEAPQRAWFHRPKPQLRIVTPGPEAA